MQVLLRFIKIYLIICRQRLDHLIDKRYLPWFARLLLAIGPHRFFKAPQLPIETRCRLALESLGPVFIKFGQALSTRRDLFAPAAANELAKLQDRVPPFDGELAKTIVERELGAPIETLFAYFNTQALASASIAQVHEARLLNGDEVVVKVVRPGILKLIKQDIALMYSIARLAEKYLPDGPRLHPVELVHEYEITVLDELDMQREAANTSQLRRNFLDSDLLYVPKVYFDCTRSSLLVMERIYGIPIGDNAEMIKAGINFKVLAERGVEIFFTQVFRDNFFHADMHPGNIFVSREHPDTPQYIGIDCAIIGSLSEFDRYYLARNLLAVFKRDYNQVAKLHIESGWVPKTTRLGDFEGAIRSACEPIFEKPLSEISFAQILIYLFKVARRFEMEVQPSLVLLQKTLLNIEGLGRELYPDLNLWDTAMPFLENWMAERYAPSGLLKEFRKHLPEWLEQLPQVPDLVLNSLQHTPQQSYIARDAQVVSELRQQQKRLRRNNKILALCLVIAVIVMLKPDLVEQLNVQNLLALALAGIAATTLLKH